MTLSRRPEGALAKKSLLDRLPVSSREVLDGLAPKRVLELEKRYGNGDMYRLLDALGIVGPLTVISPWELEDDRGRHLIHAGGFAALPFGETYPPLVEFLKVVLERKAMGFAQTSAAAWRAALETNLVALLAAVAPSHADSQVFFSNSGAEAVEAAIKFVRAARPGAGVLINFSRAYHGKTLGALSLTPNEGYQAPFRPLLGEVRTVPYGDATALEREIYRIGPKNVAGIFIEPIQGEGGVIVPAQEFLPAVDVLAKRYGIPVVADEVQTGLGRSGHWFASVAGGLDPDIVTLAKPLSGGLVPIGATIARRWIVRKMLGGLESRRHSNTFGGGAIAAAVAVRSLELIIEEGLVEKARHDGERGLRRLREIAERYPGYVREVRGAGMLFGLRLRHIVKPRLLPGARELVPTLGTALALRSLHLGGVHVCFALNDEGVVRLTPALNMPESLFDEMFDRVERVARSNRAAWQMIPRVPVHRLARLARLAAEG